MTTTNHRPATSTEQTYGLVQKFCISCGLSRPIEQVKSVPGTPVNVGVCLRCTGALCIAHGIPVLPKDTVVLRKKDNGKYPRRPTGAKRVLYC